ncbi:bifunctional 4-hydroxy-2-oxoglutarate aldolase/2-dehydro-3-deoxy-phosphogluconate aldolase [Prauserella cavernicola]|uniref:Bifunctional 4-hydroxy-2-oxoglutarate aldolase/2-dehydro-3-deoxy-phosphogluconate aldolase n=1 Tax=Prauserella cavernicola TaxID=2800127 RepID=A0A934QPL0_9PSEU|nr:bifunctional 4-hydroxy-2-oxoglutarate aldolase/2-dehydro-3-deoxy-phosphogluconate aldolase [Prauserella cavernicola]MBK1784295.1 bifunctional 4-hydroxy-2-oxoglutarate aldolase/2-dehydro-3-deoxy-phosphogluconate aldolase [Prauserella cavernicola]
MTDVVAAALDSTPVVGIIRLPDASGAVAAAEALWRGGVHAVEVTLTTRGAADAIRALRDREQGPGVIGAGSVRTEADAREAIAAGARFLVTPTFRPAVLDAARAEGVPVMCGGLTPTELDSAAQAGADYLKLFPASAVGPGYLRELLAPMPDLRIIPTGGIGADDVATWAAAGAHAVAAGSALVSAELVARQDWAELTARAERFARSWPR